MASVVEKLALFPSEELPNFTSHNLLTEFEAVSRHVGFLGKKWTLYYLIMGQCERRAAFDLLTLINEDLNGCRVADLGCGGGVMLSMLARRFPGAEIRGTDFCAAMLRACSETLTQNRCGGNVTMVRENALNMAAPNAAYDSVVSTFLLDMLLPEQIIVALTEIRRILKRGGAAYLAVLSSKVASEHGRLAAIRSAALNAANLIYAAMYRNRLIRRLSQRVLGYYIHCCSIDLISYIAWVPGLHVVQEQSSRIVTFGIPILPVDIVKLVRE